MGRLFGTDGVRGTANSGALTPEMAVMLGRASAYVLASKRGIQRPRVVIGKDTRISGYLLEFALASGLLSVGADVWLCGPLPTPAVAFLVRSGGFDVGAVVSASHNPYPDNGIKFFDSSGFKLPDEMEEEIERVMDSSELDSFRPTGSKIGRAHRFDGALERYAEFLVSKFPGRLDLKGLKLVVDCANGAAYRVAPLVFGKLGASVELVSSEPNGTNINDGCGSLYPRAMCEAVRRLGADVGIAFDGDADRVIMCDEKGNVVDGDHLMAICARRMIEEGSLNHNTLVATVMSNMGLEEALRRMGGRVVRCPVGDRYVVETMRSGGYNLGGEQSGHIVFLDKSTTGDGILSALEVLVAMVVEGKPLSELAEVMETYPQILFNVRVREKRPIEEMPEVKSAIDDAKRELGEQGRILVRYSGTENLARVMVEGKDESVISGIARRVAELFEKKLGEG